ncbi:DeoR/GlpR family DNA-binding transcription regulator [Roseospira visakhapatnamensis]|uniref:DeoR family deoxyribose operon repressor n=1 Tax=Roseospira visakhapatnamensis TaxID=390880 RepID=A0A7W6WAG8_9PROT|nr:DeoR/GlpR family DNA-binding transcription regulator [Roseospira visakhapatnamensis]MBB4266481.1 DeoR family deoxyribose operon repressor [Roseospira visakhapatnamensis]
MRTRRQHRLETLAATLDTAGSLHLKKAACLLQVSEMTVRRDIAASGGRFSYLGGHIISASDTAGGRGYFFDKESETNTVAKRAACQVAASLIDNEDTVFIDCGTTMPHLAHALPSSMSLTVVCYAVNVAEIVCKRPNLKVILLGGLYYPSSASFASREALDTLRRIGINKAFLSAGGVHVTNGISCSNFHEVGIKQLAMERALRTIVIADSSKFGKVKPAYFAALDDVQAVVTDTGLAAPERAALSDRGIALHLPD